MADNSSPCPVCGWRAGAHTTCPCCGLAREHPIRPREAWAIRGDWISAGALWSQPDRRPSDWDLQAQLAELPDQYRHRWSDEVDQPGTRRLSRNQLLVGSSALGLAAGGAVGIVTGVVAWPVIGAVVGVGIGDLAAGRR